MVELSEPTIRRILLQMRIGLERDELPSPGGAERSVLIQSSRWEQPSETCYAGNDPEKGILWRILTGKGLKAFKLTKEDSDETLAEVARAAASHLGSRKRKVVCNHAGLRNALRLELNGWNIDDE